MKSSELFKPWKPKKPKKKPDPWFFVWGGGVYPEGGEGGALPESADPEYRKVHTLEDMPERLHISKSFYLLHVKGRPWFTYEVRQFMENTPIAKVMLFPPQEGTASSSWVFDPVDDKYRQETVFVSNSQLYNALKLKWWVTNRLIEIGKLPPRSSDAV